ncbi:hypothetical protein [Candidatus Pantoea multigeneris]|uniref:Uncharacterized protein n=1 Tax=Candidatus Pantoea multigeneris TaxID=2608357 RepID=A0ABX0REX8_9GAMM|nr:hypothetical protein [Pantoea multigeneris]NIF23915.1 hypothetical protein [Pantoea multigeneris]
MSQGNVIRFRHAEHCGWLISSDRRQTFAGRESDERMAGLQALGYRIKKVYCKPGMIPDDGYVALLGATLRRLLEVSPADPVAMDILSKIGTPGAEDLYIDMKEIAAQPVSHSSEIKHE